MTFMYLNERVITMEIKTWDNPDEKRKYEAYSFNCKICGQPFFMDGLQLLNLKNRFLDSYKEPTKCLSCKNKFKLNH